MSTQSKTYYYSVYETLLEIEEGDHREQVRFVEKNLGALQHLDLEEYFETMCRYHQALFELGVGEKQLKIADEILEMSIMHNITEWRGDDIFFETLFKKAAAYYNKENFEQSQHHLKELLKIKPHHEPSKLLLINTFVKENKKGVAPFRTFGIAAILLSAAIIAFELIVVRRSFSMYVEYVELARNASFGAGVVGLIAGEVWIRYKAVDKTLELIQYYKDRKKIK